MRIGVVVSCYRQGLFLPRTVAALEGALAGEDWRGVLELAAPSDEPAPALSDRWRVVASFDPASGRPRRPLTPGAGRMTGLAACEGEWIFFVDSDMELDASWVRAAIETARREPELAGVGGRIEEWFVDGAGERPGQRDLYRTGDRDRAVGYLGNVAFYRRDALEQAGGYDPALSSDEDFELGLRLRSRGLTIRCLGQRAGRHWSAPRPNLRELERRWRTGLCFGQGQVLRLYLGRRGFGALLVRQWIYVVTIAMWTLGLVALAAWAITGSARALVLWALAPLALLAFMTARKRSLRLAIFSLLTWTLNGLGMVVGLFHSPAVPTAPAPAAEPREGSAGC
ncbi:MAG TPA: glycosyltransferase family 2 protein [Terriglobales bacterium]|nr:glycosyltransferase family 2 protein [Terriglobales bacterium]